MEDSELLYKWITNRDLVILNAQYHHVSEAEHLLWMESMMRCRPDSTIFVIEETALSTPIGTCQLLNINRNHRAAELQIRIGETAYHGHGYGSEAVKQLCNFGFFELHLHRIYLHVFSSNERAIRAYQKCGFIHEGRLREAAFINGRWEDILVMAVLNPAESM